MPVKNAWEGFFDAHAPDYERRVSDEKTLAEVDFLLAELNIPPGGAVLDVGCGAGQHAVELARRGYAVTGLDFSANMLKAGRKAARAAGVEVEWLKADATRFRPRRRYDAVICICEGSFGLLGHDDDPLAQPLAILRNIHRCLKPGAKAVFTLFNGAAMIRRWQAADIAQGKFDPLALVTARERGFVPTELVLLFRFAGLSVLHIWGGTTGHWGKRLPDLDETELMVVARRSSRTPVPGTVRLPRD